MKYIVFFLIIISCKLLHAQDSLPVKMRNDLINAFITGNEKILEPYFLTENELNDFVVFFATEKGSAISIKEQIKSKQKEIYEQLAFLKQDTIVDWGTIQYRYNTLAHAGVQGEEGMKLELYNITLHFTDARLNEIELVLRKCFYFNKRICLPPLRTRLNVKEDPEVVKKKNEELLYTQPRRERTDTLLWFSNVKDAITYAQKNSTFIAIYYQPEKCSTCTYTVRKLLWELKDEYSYFNTTEVNKKFAIVIAENADTVYLKENGVKSFFAAMSPIRCC
jgi:hypothetical protein